MSPQFQLTVSQTDAVNQQSRRYNFSERANRLTNTKLVSFTVPKQIAPSAEINFCNSLPLLKLVVLFEFCMKALTRVMWIL